ncbi:hypothetical protein [Nocardioides sp. SYSU DS0651]|uniref:hypothetical protein n=1 Tax=Nocardioides sp. SYSU DS0651 TaxID=3415955 RepID=UPI003F4BF810
MFPDATATLSAGVPAVLPLHGRWFVDEPPGGDWGFFLSPLPLALTAAVAVVAVLWRLVAARITGPELPVLAPLARLVPWVPRLLGVHLGVSLLALAATGAFVTPAVDHLHGPAGSALLLAEAAIGVWLITGVWLRAASAVVLGMGPALALVSGPVALLECANLAAVAAFLVFVPIGADRHGASVASPAQVARGLLALRLGVGIALIALAFTEKLTNPGMAVAVVEQHPVLNVFTWVGIDMSPTTFVTVAGAVEILFGLLVISGALPQVAVLVAMVPFNATLLVFGQTELVGHLPVYGVFLALLAYGSHPQLAPLVKQLPSLRRSGGTDTTSSTVPTAPSAPVPA